MKNLIKYGFIAFVICFLSSCDTTYGDAYDDMLVYDSKGRVYKLRHTRKDLYFVVKQKIDLIDSTYCR